MTRIIAILSGKGGVGKTTLTFNLGAALNDLGKNVVIIDGNLTTPNLGLHAGLPVYERTLHDVLRGKYDIFDVIRVLPNGLKLIPASINIKDLDKVNPELLPAYVLDLVGKFDVVIIDGAAGLGREAISALNSCDEVIGISTPDLPSLTDLLRLYKVVEKLKKKYVGTVINRITNKPHEFRKEDIFALIEDLPILGYIPEDEHIPLSIKKRIPVLHLNPKAKSSKTIKKLSYDLLGYEYPEKEPWHRRLFKLFGLRVE